MKTRRPKNLTEEEEEQDLVAWREALRTHQDLMRNLRGLGNTTFTADEVVTTYQPRSDMLRYLNTLRHEGKELTYENVAQWGAQVADHLRVLHGEGWAHNDIKPHNILMSGTMNRERLTADPSDAALIDFDAATPLGQKKIDTPDGWAAPEIRDKDRSERIATTQADVFGLSAVLLYALTGHRLNTFVRDRTNPALSWMDRYEAAYGYLRDELARVPEPLAAVVLSGLAREPHRRPTAAGLQDDLYACKTDPRVRKRRGFAPPAGWDEKSRESISPGFHDEDLAILEEIGYTLRMENTK